MPAGLEVGGRNIGGTDVAGLVDPDRVYPDGANVINREILCDQPDDRRTRCRLNDDCVPNQVGHRGQRQPSAVHLKWSTLQPAV